MDHYVVRNNKKLRCGYTTGSCAAGAAKAAAQMLLTGEPVETVRLLTPKGIALDLEVIEVRRERDFVCCAVKKDGGDDPDVTHGLDIYAQVSKIDAGIVIEGGRGVGQVTRPGLSCPPGGPAINPVPMDMIRGALEETARAQGYGGGLRTQIFVPGGEKVAAGTFNPRLGILGGISILGTSGIVSPMSREALVDTIHVELDSLWAKGVDTLLICPGNYGADFALEHLGIDLAAGVRCSNYIGEAMDYAVYKGFERLLLVGHGGKLIKLAAGVFQTHSCVADCRQEVLASHAALAGADRETVGALLEAITIDECIEILDDADLRAPVLDSVRVKIENHLKARLRRIHGGSREVEFVVFTNRFGELIRSAGALRLVEQVKKGGTSLF